MSVFCTPPAAIAQFAGIPGPVRPGRVLAQLAAMTPDDLRKRLATYAVDVVALTKPIVGGLESRDPAIQLRRAASGAASNHRAAGRARSHREFTSKLNVALEEADESCFWLEHCLACGWLDPEAARPMLDEGTQLVKILAKSHDTARGNDRDPPDPPRRPRRR